MASKNIGKTNYLKKNKTHFISTMIVFVSILIKLLFLNHNGAEVALGFYGSILSLIGSIVMIFAFAIKHSVKDMVQYKRVRNLYRNSLSYIKISALISFVLGVIVMLGFIFGSHVISESLLYMNGYGTFIIIFLSVSVPFVFMDAAILGSFDAFGYDLPKNAFKIVFSVFDLLLGFLCIFISTNIGTKHGLLLHNSNVISSFACVGAAFAFTISVVLSTLWLLVLTKVLFQRIRNTSHDDMSRTIDSMQTQLMTYLHSIAKPFLNGILFFLPFIAVQLILFFKLSGTSQTGDDVFISTEYGKYIYEYIIWFLIPIFTTSVLANYTMDYVRKLSAKGDKYHCGMRMLLSTKQFICLPLPLLCFFGLSIRALNTTFWYEEKTSAVIIALLAAILYSYSYLILRFLVGLQKHQLVLIILVVGMLVEIFFFAGLFTNNGNGSVSAILKANLIYALVVALLSTLFIKKYFVYKKHLSRHIYMPLIALIALVVTVLLVNLVGQISIPFLGVVLAFILGFIAHTLSLTILGVAKENEMHEFPQGKYMTLLGNLLGIETL